MARTANRYRHSKAPQMSREDALRFEQMSEQNAALIKDAIPCDCEPYKDVFTFNRWKALGYSVMKGEHGVKIDIYAVRTIKDNETGEEKQVKARAKAVVFCRCQVQDRDEEKC